MNAKTKTQNHSAKLSKATTAASETPADLIVHQLNDDARNAILVVSVLVNAFVLIGWLVVEVSTRYDAAIINYLQNR